ncbi:MAG: sporulation integral membrane protein YtvI [Oscillospiraceae bacterium]|nr:sporulation integral membrane protein YtvI [Oscillospiraceae bacterium]
MEQKKKFVINAAFFGIIFVLGYAAYKYILPILVPFIIGFLVAAIVHLPLKRIPVKKSAHRRWLSALFCTLFYGIVAALLVLFGYGIFSKIANLVQLLPDIFQSDIYPFCLELAEQIEVILNPIDPELAQWIIDIGKNIATSLGQLATTLSASAIKLVASSAVSIPGVIIQIVLVIVVSFYTATDYDRVISFLTHLVPSGKRSIVLDTLGYMKTAVLVYIKSYSILFFITFLELLIGLTILKIPYSLAIALCIAIFDLMPVLGTGGVLIPWTIILLVMGNFPLALGMAILYIIITAVRNAIEPRIIGDQIGLHPLVTLIAMMLGLGLFGLFGMLLFPVALVAIMNLMKKNKQSSSEGNPSADSSEAEINVQKET